MKNKKMMGIVSIIIIVAIVAGVFLYYPSTDIAIYNTAMQYYENEDYSNAIDEFYKIKKYKDADLYIQNSKYIIACQKYESKEYIESYQLLISIKYIQNLEGYKKGDLKNLINECESKIQEIGKKYFDEGEYVEANKYWEVSCGAYGTENSICSKIVNRQGTLYDRLDFSKKISLNNTTVTIRTNGDGGVADGIYETYLQSYINAVGEKCWGLFFEDKDIYLTLNTSDTYTMLINDEDIENSQIRFYQSMEDAIEANNQVANFNNKNKIKEPTIGMTAEEVRNSTWGEPEDINKTTYVWGTTEQWCYSGYRYIYFENGIVTAISE